MATTARQPPSLSGAWVGLGPDRIVEIAGVRAVDGHQRQRPQVGAAVEARRRRLLRLRQRRVGEAERQAVGVDRGEADRAGRVRVAQPLDHFGVGQPEPAAGLGLAHHQLARAGTGGLLRRHHEAAAGAALGGLNYAAAAAGGAEDADHPARAGIEHAHGPRQVAAIGRGPEPREHAVAFPRLGNAAGRGVEGDRRGRIVFVPARRPGRERAVLVEAVDLQHRDRRQVPAGRRRVRRASIAPSASSARTRSFSAARSLPRMLKARAISRIPVLPGLSRTKRRTSSLVGKGAGLPAKCAARR